MKLQSFLAAIMLCALFAQCKKGDPTPGNPSYSPEVANAWMKMHIRLVSSTPGYNSVVSDRSFGYAGIAMYESVLPGIVASSSLLTQIGGTSIAPTASKDQYYWPASLNAAMATLTRNFFPTTSPANLSAIDSLENVYKTKFAAEASADKITNAQNFGVQVATAVYKWSKTDGADEAYLHVTDPSFVPQSGPGKWVPTSPTQLLPICPHWGDNRSFIPGIATSTQPAPPTAYSEDVKSAFYAMVNELYTISLSLTHDDSVTAKFWGDQPGNQNVPAHATNILMQLIELNKKDLYGAAAAYALHGIALNDASIAVFKTKYKYSLVRPATYIRTVMAHPAWNSVIPTPPHPEYTAAHAVISAASAVVLESIFGKNTKFTDHTYDNTYGARSFNSFDAYAQEAGRARLLAGIHYSPSIATGLTQGRQVGNIVVKLNVKY